MNNKGNIDGHTSSGVPAKAAAPTHRNAGTMRPAVASFSFEVLPLEATFMIARDLEFSMVDLAGFQDRGRCSFEPTLVAENPQAQADKVLPLLERYNLSVSDFFVQFGAAPPVNAINSPERDVRERGQELLKGSVHFANLVGAPGITILPGVDHSGRRDPAELHRSRDALLRAMDTASAAGVQLRFEPHMGSITDTPELALELLDMVPGLTVTLDAAHFSLQYIPLERVLPLAVRTGHVHIRQARPGTLQVAWDDGSIDFDRVLRELAHHRYSGALAVEYVCADWFGVNRNDTLHESMVAHEALREILRELP